jgi:DNA (cytosine-5)-methyltransferase 1
MKRKNEDPSTPAVDLYVAGFPCQSFSLAGCRKGFKDKRGMVFFGCADYIDCKRPRAFLLENVKGLKNHDKGKTMQCILDNLRGIGNGAYEVTWQLVDTKEHGVPQNRQRTYFIGIRRDCMQSLFQFPEKLPPVSIEGCLDPPRKKRMTLSDLPSPTNKNFYQNVKRMLAELLKEGKDPFRKTYCFDAESTPKFATIAEDRSMCITARRAAGHWVTTRGRRMNIDEMLRLQGMERCFKQVVSNRQLGIQIGNAMSQNVIERILIKLLPAAGLVQKGTVLKDRWMQNGVKPIIEADSKTGTKRIAQQVDVGTAPKKRQRVVMS